MLTTKTTFTISSKELIKNFTVSTLDLLQGNVELYDSPADFCLDLESFSKQLKSLLGRECFAELQKLFREGYSTMLLNSSDIDTLEELDKNNQDYQLLVTDSADNLIGFLQKEDITW